MSFLSGVQPADMPSARVRPAGASVPAPCPAPVADAMRAAASAGLHWSSDSQPGLTRMAARGGAWRLHDSRGRRVRDEATLARVRRLVIPPAWRDVWVCADPRGHLQATGRDARGRKQYRYHPDWTATRGDTKFEHLQVFARVLPRIRRAVRRELARPVPRAPTRELVIATLVRLLDTTWLRIGNDEYARENGSYGLSTLHRGHLASRRGGLQVSFVGKSGVRHEVALEDPRVARVVRRCRELPGQELFQYVADDGTVQKIDSADVNEWLARTAGERVTAKDFRTWHGSVFALELTLAACAAGPGSSDCATPQAILKRVAQRLGNTVAVCRKAYVHPEVLVLGDLLHDAKAREALRAQGWTQLRAVAGGARGLTAGETRLARLLSRRRRTAPRAARRGGAH